MSNLPDTKPRKTRNRIPTSCLVCRGRRIKCGKQKPHCLNCQANDSVAMCFYEQKSTRKAMCEQRSLRLEIGELQKRFSVLLQVIEHHETRVSEAPPAQSHDVLELVDQLDTMVLNGDRPMYFGPTSYMSLLTNDSVMKPAVAQMIGRYKEANYKGINTRPDETPSAVVDETESDSDSQLLSLGRAGSAGEKLQRDFSSPIGLFPSPTEKVPSAEYIDQSAASLTAIFPSEYGSIAFQQGLSSKFLEILPSINLSLPSRTCFDLLIDRFFSHVYVCMPYIDEVAFRREVEEIIFTNMSGNVYFNIDGFTHLVTISMCLMLMRFAYLSIPVDQLRSLAPYEASLMDAHMRALHHEFVVAGVTIESIYVENAKVCLSYGTFFRKPNMRNIQAFLYLCLYRFHCPEKVEEGTDLSVLLSMFLQLAHMSGMHRDFAHFDLTIIQYDEQTKHLWRKIWYALVYLDCAQAAKSGCPMIVYDQFDTQYPAMTRELVAEGGLHLHEAQAVEHVRLSADAALLVRAALCLLTQIHRACKVSEHHEHNRRIEEFLATRIPTFDELFVRPQSETLVDELVRLNQLLVRVFLTYVQYTTNYALALACAEDAQLDTFRGIFSDRAAEKGFLLFKLGYMCIDEWKLVQSFPSGTETMLVVPVLYMALRALQMVTSVCVRSLYDLFSLYLAGESFQSSDLDGLVAWLGIGHATNERQNLESIVNFLHLYLQHAQRLAEKRAISMRISLILISTLVYLNDVGYYNRDVDCDGGAEAPEEALPEISQDAGAMDQIFDSHLYQVGIDLDQSFNLDTPQEFFLDPAFSSMGYFYLEFHG
ncbi:hypothetical protein BABINDRAFT_160993 [Babjeviella inositovora NRRL Y-12698]|uniref:Zn(2)-C6 fungal-type domain-containing protein n=1 Tax=Babjeviella inositovora NRRL Y-12698 TaxID=984486 RepID=A0A1E3QSY3_9ASCO|nr:uncharacterized protein BABINDRAFT_160993 [Babjeviella inositovora NRRL Y-12698]ODQ80780.1 hypothetical protein BABINDRAFT_160993 [Babjeviella inositovora NRRL Y-12698]